MAKATATKGAVKNAPAVQPKREVSTKASAVPAYMAGKAGKGLVGINDSDLEMPRVYLLTAVHTEVETFEEAEPGMIWHNVLEQALAGKGADLRFTPILITKGATLWRPRGDGNGGILARCNSPSDPDAVWNPSNTEFTVKLKNVKKPVVWNTKGSVAESGLLDWGSSDPEDNDSQPAATLSYRILAAFPDFPDIGLAVITCQRSSVKPAKKMLTSIRMSNAPSYGLVYKMGSKLESGPEGDFHNVTFTGDGFVSEDQFSEYEVISKSFAGKDFYGKGEDAEAQATGGNVSGGGKTPDTKGKY